MGFKFEQHRLGLWDLSWDYKKTIYWEMGLGPPFMILNKGGKKKRWISLSLIFFFTRASEKVLPGFQNSVNKREAV